MLDMFADSTVQRKTSKSGYDITPLTQAQRDELAAKVDATTRHIALESGTERAFTGKTVNGMLLPCYTSCAGSAYAIESSSAAAPHLT